jgi:hypothetical protein
MTLFSKAHVATHWLPSASLPAFENALVELTKKTDHTASDIEIDKLITEFAKPHQDTIISEFIAYNTIIVLTHNRPQERYRRTPRRNRSHFQQKIG